MLFQTWALKCHVQGPLGMVARLKERWPSCRGGGPAVGEVAQLQGTESGVLADKEVSEGFHSWVRGADGRVQG